MTIEVETEVVEKKKEFSELRKYNETEEKVFHLKKEHTELQEKYFLLEEQYAEINKKENEAGKQLLEVKRENIRMEKQLLLLSEKVDQLERRGIEDKNENQEALSQVKKLLGVEKVEKVKIRIASLPQNPPCHHQICRVFSLQLSSLFVNSTFLVCGLVGNMPCKSKSFGRIVKFSPTIFSLIPLAGGYASAGAEIASLIYSKIQEEKNKTRAANIVEILKRFVDWWNFEEVNLFAASITVKVVQSLKDKIERFIQSQNLLKPSWLRRAVHRVFHKSLTPEIKAAFLIFEGLFLSLYKIDPANFKPCTETEFEDYCVHAVHEHWDAVLGN